ncbi:hypothetical protein [Chitinimonas taiwanensis]|uniref:Uncharacterized protein n=1 Tax=Chitinimonas taiwanensis DSM 18899 TaxID=1121279 RepID=A0A1K2HKK5_9NEIS|nr:hypothetical protein [Chitinimonas taiwanensis]SFZ77356.1 hypothetical protein SAMN02745887_02360 [Chitinimonas taiwanensis DSM 18899]
MEKIYSTVVESPHLYDIEYFAYGFDDEDNSKSYIDLHLKKGGEECKLRFWGPRDLQIEKGFPYATGGMYIEDVSKHGLDSLNVYVGDFEAAHGSITFWAKDVEKKN